MHISETKLLDALHAAMPSDQDASQTNVAMSVKKSLQGIVDRVKSGELDAESEKTEGEKNIGKLNKAGDEGLAEAGKALAKDNGEK